MICVMISVMIVKPVKSAILTSNIKDSDEDG